MYYGKKHYHLLSNVYQVFPSGGKQAAHVMPSIISRRLLWFDSIRNGTFLDIFCPTSHQKKSPKTTPITACSLSDSLTKP